MWMRGFAIGAYLIGLGGAGVLFAYIVGTGVGFWPRGEAADGSLPWLVNLGWLLLFALQHSGMARQTFKKIIVRLVPAALERSLYVGTSGIVVGAMTLFWQPLPGEPLWHGPSGIIAICFLAALGIAFCASFDHWSFFGVRQAWTGNAEIREPLCIKGPYRYVRHPLMLGLLIALWAQPIMPPELLMMNAGLTIYILIAIRLEERDLVREFGNEYEQYRKSVPALIPYRIFV